MSRAPTAARPQYRLTRVTFDLHRYEKDPATLFEKLEQKYPSSGGAPKAAAAKAPAPAAAKAPAPAPAADPAAAKPVVAEPTPKSGATLGAPTLMGRLQVLISVAP